MTTSEFRFLSSDAARVQRTAPIPIVERLWADVNGSRRVSALAFAPESRPQLVALHGAGLNAHSFDPVLLALDVPALAIDLPGHGRSDWRDDADYRPDHLAADVVTTLEQFAPHPVTLVGHSLGGLTAALVASARPELVSQLVVVDITPGISPSRDAGAITDFILGQRDYGSVEEIVDRAIQFGIGSDPTALTRGVSLNTRLRDDGRLEWTHHLAHLERPFQAGAEDDPQPYSPIWASLRALDMPVTLVRASAGVVSDELTDEWRDQLPNSSVVSVDGPHNLHEAAPQALAHILHRVLAG